MRALGLILLTTLLLAGPAQAHGAAAQPGWSFDPWITAPLLAAFGLFVVGWTRLRARARGGLAGLRRRAVLFGLGWTALAFALVSPLHQAGARSFAAHMLEHELIMLAAAPLLALSQPLAIMIWSFPAATRRGLGRSVQASGLAGLVRRLTQPVTATLVQAAVLWLWHAPSLFERALARDGWHIVQHLAFLVSALLFWTGVLTRRPFRADVSALCLFATSVVSGALGAMMAFSQSPWYPSYARLGLTPFGLSPAEDQQLAGLLMWIPGGAVHAAAALVAVAAILKPVRPEAQHGV
jgi:cytochrome c oxidase assembly factor CtaG